MVAPRFLPALLLTVQLFIINVGARAQQAADSTLPILPTRIRIYTEEEWYRSPDAGRQTDQLLQGFDRDEFAPLQYQDLGAPGSASRSFFPQQFTGPFMNAGYSLADRYLLKSKTISYWRTNKRFTELNYRMGPFHQQSIEVSHSQNILTNWNSGFYFNRTNILDYLPNSDTYNGRFVFYSDYGSANDRYHLFVHALWNTSKNECNGGITDDSLVDGGTTNLDLKGLPVRLTAAGYRYRENSFHLGQQWLLSAPTDSTASTWALRTSTTFTRGSFAYSDQSTDSSFYSDYFSSSVTDDSSSFDDFRNRFSVCRAPGTSPLSLSAYLEHQAFRYVLDQTEAYDQLGAGITALYLKSDWEVSFNGLRIVQGTEANNYSAELKLQLDLSKVRLTLDGNSSVGAVPMAFRISDGNHFRWSDTGFRSVSTHQAFAEASMPESHASLRVSGQQVEGYLYMDTAGRPNQADQRATFAYITLRKSFHWRNWTTEHCISWQSLSDEALLHLPDWSTFHGLWWERDLNKKGFRLQAGLEARYLSSFYGDNFLPATGFFYLQNEILTGNVLRLDLFARLQIKTAALFLRLENAGGGLITSPYYLTPHQPQPGKVFRFGVRWRFYDQ